MKPFGILAALALCLGGATTTRAHEFFYTAALTGSQGSGTVNVELDLDLITMKVDAAFAGLPGTTTAAHVRGLTPSPFTGTAGVASQTPSLTGFPMGATSGTYSQTIDLTDASGYDPSFIAASGGTVSDALNALTFGMADGRTYFDIATASSPNGAISGFLIPAPEPASFTIIGLAAPLILRRRTSIRRRTARSPR